MGECREMTFEEELRALDISNDVDGRVIGRILRKYEDEKARDRERTCRDIESLTRQLQQKEVEIRALTGYIAMKDL